MEDLAALAWSSGAPFATWWTSARFVDVGVHQDGLVHISKMSNRFVKHPSDVVRVGDTVTVWVEKVDLQRKKISLSMVQGK